MLKLATLTLLYGQALALQRVGVGSPVGSTRSRRGRDEFEQAEVGVDVEVDSEGNVDVEVEEVDQPAPKRRKSSNGSRNSKATSSSVSLQDVPVLTDLTADGGLGNMKPIEDDLPRNGIVQIFLSPKPPDFDQPWSVEMKGDAKCTGFVIMIEEPIPKGKKKSKQKFRKVQRVLTNAHCVEHVDGDVVAVKRPGAHMGKFPAKVEYVSQQADLALLKVIDNEKKEFELVENGVVEFNDRIRLNDDLVVRGYPDGDVLVMVDGKISRMTTKDYSMQKQYVGSGKNQLLVIQTQAPINSGNSGGPAFQLDDDGVWRVVGVAVESYAGFKDNVGFLVSLQVVEHFLIDVKQRMIDDKHPMGFPHHGLQYQSTEKKNMRTMLGMPENNQGLIILDVEKDSSFYGVLQKFDVLMSVDGYDINRHGQYSPDPQEDGLTEEVHMSWLFARKFYGDKISVEIIRNKKLLKKTATLKPTHPLIPQMLLSKNGLATVPNYMIIGGMALTEVTQQYLSTKFDCFFTGDRSSRPDNLVRARDDTTALKAPRGFEGQDARIVTVADVLGGGVPGLSTNRLVKYVNGVRVYNLEHFTKLIVDAIKAARPLESIPATFKSKPDDKSMDLDEKDDDELDVEYLFGPQDFVKIDMDPTLTIALGPIQQLYKMTHRTANDNKIPVKNLFNGIDYSVIAEGVQVEVVKEIEKNLKQAKKGKA